MIGGLILIIIGIVFLLKNLGLISAACWSIVWPLILILIGFWILLKKDSFYWQDWSIWKKWKKVKTQSSSPTPKRTRKKKKSKKVEFKK